MSFSTPEGVGAGEGSPSWPLGYTLQDVNFGRLYKVATQTSKRVLKAVLVLVVGRARVATVDAWPPPSIADYCSQVLGWSNTKFRQAFNGEERVSLQQPVETTDLDVSLISKVMHKLFDDINVPETLWRSMRDVKNLRNRVCHEHLVLDEEELNQNLKDLQDTYASLLSQIGEVFAVEVEDLKKEFCAEVDEIMSSSVVVEASEYFEKVEQFRTELVGRFITQGQRELMDHYSKLQVLNPFTWLSSKNFPQLQVDKIFSPLLITSDSRGVQATTLLTAEMLNPNTEEETGVLPDVLVLSGIAGCGKTSLCRFLLHDWRTHGGAVATLRSVDIVLYIEARSVTSSSLVAFLLKTLLPGTCSHYEEKDIVQTLRKVSVLYVIDGMDEATTDAKLLASDVFSLAGGSRVIVTTRPEYTSAVTQLAELHHLSHMKLAIHGFSDEGRRAFTSRIFGAYVHDETKRRLEEKEFLKFLRTSCKGLGGYLKLPLTLALLACLWQDDKTRIAQITSATKLYVEIFRLCTTKMATRLQGSSAPLLIDLHSFVESWLLAVGKAAYDMLDQGCLIIGEATQQQLASLCEAEGVNSLQVFSAFLQCEVHTGILGVKHHFSFVHKSQMEYLAALYLSKEVMEATKSSDTNVKGVLSRYKVFRNSLKRDPKLNSSVRDIIMFSGWGAKWVNTWLFLVGHLCLKKASGGVLQAVLEAILSVRSVTHDEGTMWRLVEESSHHSLVREKVGAAMTKDYTWRPSETELCDTTNPVFMLMQHTSFTPEAVILRVVGNISGTRLLSEDGRLYTAAYDNLKPILRCVSQRPSCHVYLKLDQHYYTWGGHDTADHLLQLLQPGGNLVIFTGHLGPPGAAALASVKLMGELNVRVTDAATLEAMAKGVLDGRVGKLEVRLDLPWALLPAALPRLHASFLYLVLHGVHDDVAVVAAEAMAQLSHSFKHVDMMASRLTPEGAKQCLKVLAARQVAISGGLTVRSIHALPQDAFLNLQAMLVGGGRLAWWS